MESLELVSCAARVMAGNNIRTAKAANKCKQMPIVNADVSVFFVIFDGIKVLGVLDAEYFCNNETTFIFLVSLKFVFKPKLGAQPLYFEDIVSKKWFGEFVSK